MVALTIVVGALGAVSEIVLPLLFAAVLAIIFKPLVGKLVRHKLKPSLAAGLIVLGLLALGTLVVVATAKGVIDQRDDISASVDAAIGNAVDDLNIDQATLEETRAAIEGASPEVTGGFLTKVVSGIDALIGLAERPDPRRPHHVLPTQGRHEAAARGRRADRPRRPGGRQPLPRRVVPDPPRLRARPHDHVRHRGGVRRPGQPSCSACRSCSPSSS